eukprot:1705107-Pyramimonas_sp.AAC.1
MRNRERWWPLDKSARLGDILFEDAGVPCSSAQRAGNELFCFWVCAFAARVPDRALWGTFRRCVQRADALLPDAEWAPPRE